MRPASHVAVACWLNFNTSTENIEIITSLFTCLTTVSYKIAFKVSFEYRKQNDKLSGSYNYHLSLFSLGQGM